MFYVAEIKKELSPDCTHVSTSSFNCFTFVFNVKFNASKCFGQSIIWCLQSG